MVAKVLYTNTSYAATVYAAAYTAAYLQQVLRRIIYAMRCQSPYC